jgi:hypothetical protein
MLSIVVRVYNDRHTAGKAFVLVALLKFNQIAFEDWALVL